MMDKILSEEERINYKEFAVSLLHTSLKSLKVLNSEQSNKRHVRMLIDILDNCDRIEKLPESNELVLMNFRLLAAFAHIGLTSSGLKPEKHLAAAVHQCVGAVHMANEFATYAAEKNILMSSLRLLLLVLLVAEDNDSLGCAGEQKAEQGTAEQSFVQQFIDSTMTIVEEQTLRLFIVMKNADQEQQLGLDLLEMSRFMSLYATTFEDRSDQIDDLTEAKVLAEAAEQHFLFVGDEVMRDEVQSEILRINKSLDNLVDLEVESVVVSPKKDKSPLQSIAYDAEMGFSTDLPHEPVGADLKESWHISRRGECFGPYTISQFLGYINEGRIVPGDLIWHPSFSGWISFEEALSRIPNIS